MWKGFRGLIIVTLLTVATFIQAQENTAYSRYGLGLVNENNFINSRALGGLGASWRSTEGVNFANPASYGLLNLVTFEGGVSAVINKVSSNAGAGKTGDINLSYLNFALPVKKNIWVTAAGVMPFAQKDYLLSDTSVLSESLGLVNLFEGSGSMYTAYWGNGFKYKDFTVGFNLGYIFGSVSTTTVSSPVDEDGALDPYAFASFERTALKARGLFWNVGAQYSITVVSKELDKKSTKDLKMDVGFAYNSSYNMGNSSSLQQSSYTIYNNLFTLKDDAETYADFLDDVITTAAQGENEGIQGADIDTFKSPVNTSVNLRMPANYNVGFTFVKRVREINYWKAGFDFKFTDWGNYRGYEAGQGGSLNDSWRIAFGGEILPIGSGKKTGQLRSKSLSQLKYRGGFYYTKTPVTVVNTAINEFGINFGIAIPIRLRIVNDDGYYGYRGVHAFALGFEVGSRGTTNNDLVRDKFLRINLGIQLNDKWFVKRKYN